MEFKRLDQENAAKCAWCGFGISGDQRGFLLRIKTTFDVDFSQYRGQVVELPLLTIENREGVPLMVPTADSEAAQDGIDGVMLCCSEDCRTALAETLKFEKELFKISMSDN